MSESSIRLKTVRELTTDEVGQPATYWIPAYQRGYRWTELQVTQLLEDIWEFVQNPNGGRFYCLQPIVIKRWPDRYEVVDGQQRLTTLYIILSYMGESLMEAHDVQRFQLVFETRKETSQKFLPSIDPSRAEENADFYHISRAYQAVAQWFSGERKKIRSKFLEHLAYPDELGRNVRVIWYELSEHDKPIDVFTRLNIGKILLTDAELIRALFLQRDKIHADEEVARQRKIAHEWDQMEKSLQNKAFWYFLTDERNAGQNRVGLVFRLVAELDGIAPELRTAPNPVFLHFSRRLSETGVDRDREWVRLKDQFLRLEEWFESRLLFHMVGYLIHQGRSLSELVKLAEKSSKAEFNTALRQAIYSKLIGQAPPSTLESESVQKAVEAKLDKLDYEESSSTEITATLLLFNIATLHENPKSNLRFQFELFKTQSWNIEHIRSIASDPPETYTEQSEWLERCREYLESRSVEKREQTLVRAIARWKKLEKNDVKDQFDTIYQQLLGYFEEDADSEADHTIANLALLDEGTNKSYKNAPFAIKRDYLLTRDQEGLFVPLCTRNVFLKCYNRRANNLMFWTAEDRQSYRIAMATALTNFITGNIGHD